jgi:hypothetical protein
MYSQFQKNRESSNNMNVSLNLDTKKSLCQFGVNISPVESYDFYEARTENRYVILPERYNAWLYISTTNYNNKFAFDFNPSYSILMKQREEPTNFH